MKADEAIALVMLVVTLGGSVAGLLAHRAVGWAALALLPLFVLSLFVLSPPEPGYERLHPFPVTLAVLMLALPLMTVAALLGYGTRAFVRWLRSRRDGGFVE